MTGDEISPYKDFLQKQNGRFPAGECALYGMIYFLGQNSKIDPICIMRRPRRVTPETAIFEGLETLLRLARDARAGGGEQGPMAVAESVVVVFFWGATPVWSRGGTGKGRFGEAGDKACKSLDLALRLAQY